jgi:beta-lactamase regulating signal transducer with metallopeptidase domain
MNSCPDPKTPIDCALTLAVLEEALSRVGGLIAESYGQRAHEVLAGFVFGAHNDVDEADQQTKGDHMLYTIAAVLLVLWLVGLVSGFTLGGLIHVLLAVALVTVLYKLTSRPKRA